MLKNRRFLKKKIGKSTPARSSGEKDVFIAAGGKMGRCGRIPLIKRGMIIFPK